MRHPPPADASTKARKTRAEEWTRITPGDRADSGKRSVVVYSQCFHQMKNSPSLTDYAAGAMRFPWIFFARTIAYGTVWTAW